MLYSHFVIKLVILLWVWLLDSVLWQYNYVLFIYRLRIFKFRDMTIVNTVIDYDVALPFFVGKDNKWEMLVEVDEKYIRQALKKSGCVNSPFISIQLFRQDDIWLVRCIFNS